MIQRIAADAVLLLHLGFIVLVVAGALPVFRYRWFAWIHLPAALWGIGIELTGGICPLTTIENALRTGAGEAGYAESFVEHYLYRVIYPAGLTRDAQMWFAGLVLTINVILYALILRRRAGRTDHAR